MTAKSPLRLAYVKLTNYAYCVGGQHWYATISLPNDETIETDYRLDRTAVERLNKSDRSLGYSGRYKVGDRTTRFDTRDDALRAVYHVADSIVKDKFDVIVLGSACTTIPKDIIWSRSCYLFYKLKHIVDRHEQIYAECAKLSTGLGIINPWKHGYGNELDALTHEWDRTVGEIR